MRQGTAILVLVGAAALLAGCVYDPYTGALVPCCNYYGSRTTVIPALTRRMAIRPRMVRRRWHSQGPIKASQGRTKVPPSGIKVRQVAIRLRQPGIKASQGRACQDQRRLRRRAAGWRSASPPPT